MMNSAISSLQALFHPTNIPPPQCSVLTAALSWLGGRRQLGHYFTAVIHLFLYFICTDERPAMGSRPNLASRSEVVSI